MEPISKPSSIEMEHIFYDFIKYLIEKGIKFSFEIINKDTSYKVINCTELGLFLIMGFDKIPYGDEPKSITLTDNSSLTIDVNSLEEIIRFIEIRNKNTKKEL